ncbi:MAG: hypothetical protein AAGE61_22650 [Pseudomonadota bacterium]
MAKMKKEDNRVSLHPYIALSPSYRQEAMISIYSAALTGYISKHGSEDPAEAVSFARSIVQASLNHSTLSPDLIGTEALLENA